MVPSKYFSFNACFFLLRNSKFYSLNIVFSFPSVVIDVVVIIIVIVVAAVVVAIVVFVVVGSNF